LLIEDSTDLAANVGEFLESRGLTVDYAYDGRTGLLLAGSNHYDVLMLDLNLPGIDGLTLCRRLREGAHRDLPVLMLTARDTECDIFMGFEAGADDYLTKPFSLQELLALLRALGRRAGGAGQEVILPIGSLPVRKGNPNVTLVLGLHMNFLARLERFELPTFWFVVR